MAKTGFKQKASGCWEVTGEADVKIPVRPFSREEIDEFYAMMYRVNTSFHCANPAPVNWVKGFQNATIKGKKVKRLR